MSESRWFRENVDWWEREWCLVLSSEARLCWNLLKCRIGSVGQHGRVPKSPVSLLARQWLVGEESVRQMLTAALATSELYEEGDHWCMRDPSIYAKDPRATERKQAQRERENASRMSRDCCDVTDVTVQDKTRQDSTYPPISPQGGKRREVFVKPSAQECADFAKEIGLPLSEARDFFNFFTSNGWKVGGKAPMKDWHAAMHTWKSRREKEQSKAIPSRLPKLTREAS